MRESDLGIAAATTAFSAPRDAERQDAQRNHGAHGECCASTVADAAYPKTSTHDMLTSFTLSPSVFISVFSDLAFVEHGDGGAHTVNVSTIT
jgi:hypothetical protein